MTDKVFDSSNPITLDAFKPDDDTWQKAVESYTGEVEGDESIDDLLGIKPDGTVEKEKEEVEVEAEEESEEEVKVEEGSEEAVYLDIGEFEGPSYKVELPNGHILEVPASAKIYNKVDGKFQPFELKEQMGVASGSVAISKRFQELDVEKKQLSSFVEQVKERESKLSGSVKKFMESLRSDDPEQGVQALADALDMEPGTLIDAIMGMGQVVGSKIFDKEIVPKFRAMGIDVEAMFNSTDPKIVAYRNALLKQTTKEIIEERNARFKGSKAQSLEQEQKVKVETQQQVNAYVISKYEQYGITDDDIVFANKVLDYHGKREAIENLRVTKGPKAYIDAMVDHAVEYKKAADIASVLDVVNPRLKSDNAFVDKIGKLYVPGRHDIGDLEEIVKSLIGKSSNKKVVPVQKKAVADRLKTSYSTDKGSKQTFKSVDDFKKLIPR